MYFIRFNTIPLAVYILLILYLYQTPCEPLLKCWIEWCGLSAKERPIRISKMSEGATESSKSGKL